jgi:hypothetical protein
LLKTYSLKNQLIYIALELELWKTESWNPVDIQNPRTSFVENKQLKTRGNINTAA